MAIVVFVGVEVMPSDACTARVEVLENCRDRLGLNRPPVERFFAWAGDLARSDLGVPTKRERPIVDIVGPRLRNTLILAVSAALAGVPLAIGLGVTVALRRDRPHSRSAPPPPWDG